MWITVRKYLEMVRFSHTLFALPFALTAAVMAWAANLSQTPPVYFRLLELIAIIICMATARNSAMSFNRLVDSRVDAENPRTASRHIPSGQLSSRSVLWFTILNSICFILATMLFLPRNPIPILMSIPVLLFLCGYSFAKRFTSLSHFWLGAALMLAPLAAWCAIRPVFSWAPVILASSVMFWVAGFDIIYACQDVEFDRRRRLHSVPARFGVLNSLRIAMLCHFLMLAILFLLPIFYSLMNSAVYYIGLIPIGSLLFIEHCLVRPSDLDRVNIAFFYINAILSVGLFLTVLISLLL